MSAQSTVIDLLRWHTVKGIPVEKAQVHIGAFIGWAHGRGLIEGALASEISASELELIPSVCSAYASGRVLMRFFRRGDREHIRDVYDEFLGRYKIYLGEHGLSSYDAPDTSWTMVFSASILDSLWRERQP